MLITAARLFDGRLVDVTLNEGRIADLVDHQPGRGGDIDARGGLLLPGLHDHHVHIAATAATLASVRCGPSDVTDEAGLFHTLAGAAGSGWLRGIGYHESVAGRIDRAWLDAAVPDRPVRLQHRSGRMWIFNSVGLDLLLAGREPPPALDRVTGWLFDADRWLRDALHGMPPDLSLVSRNWSRWGVTGLTDMNPENEPADATRFSALRREGTLAQRVTVAGRATLAGMAPNPWVAVGPLKVHLHEAHLPAYDTLTGAIDEAHRVGRGVAIHCVTETELVFALAALREAGPDAQDRIEHASVATDELVTQIAALGLSVVSQPNFVAERGDAYLADIAPSEWSHLYRLRSFLAAGVPLAGGTDTPFGMADPWAAMAAAVTRRTAAGVPLSLHEALTPEEALGLFLADPMALSRQRTVAVGAPADLCLLTQDWEVVRADLGDARVAATIVGGRCVHQDPAPATPRSGD